MKKLIAFLLLALVVLTGCATRSISDSGFRYGYYGGEDSLYKGELSEFDVLGVVAGQEHSEVEINAALNRPKEAMTLKKGDAVILIQSGAMIPDEPMLDAMQKHFSVQAFSGIPDANKEATAGYANSLRFAAAKAGIGKIIVYWGILESGTKNLATKTVSWAPVVGRAIPDQTQELRIRLKVAMVDVKTGQWDMFIPQTFQDKAVSAEVTREQSDQGQVALLKAHAYAAAVDSIMARYVR